MRNFRTGILFTTALAVSISCKSGSKKSGRAPSTDTSLQTQQQLRNQMGNSTVRAIYLDGKGDGETVSVPSANLSAAGGISVEVTGMPATNVVVGLLAPPTGLTLSGTPGQYRLQGQFPANTAAGVAVTIIARDRSACTTAADCNVAPDANGIFAASAIVPNPSWDVQGRFTMQLQSGVAMPSYDPLTGGYNTGNGTSFFGQLFSDPIGAIKTGALSAWSWIKNIFN